MNDMDESEFLLLISLLLILLILLHQAVNNCNVIEFNYNVPDSEISSEAEAIEGEINR